MRGLQVDSDIWPDRTRVAVLFEGAFAIHLCVMPFSVIKTSQLLDPILFPESQISCAISILMKEDVLNEEPGVLVRFGFLGRLLLKILKELEYPILVVCQHHVSMLLASTLGADDVLHFDDSKNVKTGLEAINWEKFPCIIKVVTKEGTSKFESELISSCGCLVIAGFHERKMWQSQK